MSLPVVDHPSLVTMRDGTAVSLRVAQPADHDAVQRFFHELSPASRWRRFFTMSDPDDGLIRRFCESSDPRREATVLALCGTDPARLIAVASYIRIASGVAEAAFAVDDAFQGKGLGTMLLTWIVATAAANGFHQLESNVLRDNTTMLDVLRHSGFETRSTLERGTSSVLLSLSLPASRPAA